MDGTKTPAEENFSRLVKEAQARGPRREIDHSDPGVQLIEGRLSAIADGQPERTVLTDEQAKAKVPGPTFIEGSPQQELLQGQPLHGAIGEQAIRAASVDQQTPPPSA